jgi:acyl-CoA synthetase (AMP-forming)/AMP-acid ligase II/acyl carrier protein
MIRSFERIARETPELIAIEDDAASVTFAELSRNRSAFQQALLEPGTVLVAALPSGVAFTTVQLACFAAGAIFVPIPHRSTEREAHAFLDLVDPDILVVNCVTEQAGAIAACPGSTLVVTFDPSVPPGGRRSVVTWEQARSCDGRVRPAGSWLPRETRTVQFTSGSTGRPKGILVSNENWLATLRQNAEHLASFEGRPVFCPLPQFHAMGNAVVMEHLLNGSPVHVANEFDPAGHVARLERHRCTAILASPNYFKLMLRLGAISSSRLPDLRSFTIGTAAVDEALVRELRGLFPDVTIYCRYGLSESVGAMARATLRRGGTPFRKGLIGTAVPGVTVRAGIPRVGARDPVELAVKSGANAIGQIEAKGEVTALVDPEGFLATGDLVWEAEDGQLVAGGRISSFLKSNGYRINPFEIEDLLRNLPGVQEAVVVGVHDLVAGQRLIACVEASPGCPTPVAAELLAACEAELSPHKVPQGFLVLPSLPRTPAGKPDRTRALAAATEWQERLAAANSSSGAAAGALPDRVLAIVCREISRSVGQPVTVGMDDALDQYLDSLAMVSLVVALQGELETTIPVTKLTKDHFASVREIVALLEETPEPSLAATPELAPHARVRAPLRKFFVAAAAAALLLAVLVHGSSDDKGPLTVQQLRATKARCSHCADLVLAGSSQTSVNLSPAAMAEVLPGRRIFNQGFSTQPYNEGYLDMLEASLADAPHRAILLLITPVSLVMRAGDDEAAYSRTLLRNKLLLEEPRRLFRSRAPCELLGGTCSVHVYTWRYPDGWCPQSYVGVPPAGGVHTSAVFMRRWAQTMRYDPAQIQHFVDRIRSWRQAGITVYALRAPVPPEMLAAELTIPAYDEAAMVRTLADAGASWIAVEAGRYVGFDGWHMERSMAERFSREVAGAIAALERGDGSAVAATNAKLETLVR